MGKATYRFTQADVFDLRCGIRHGINGDEVGLTPRQRVIARAVRQTVTPRQREILALYIVDGLGQAQIAMQLGIVTSTVSRAIVLGLTHINQALLLAGFPQIAHAAAVIL